MITLTVSNRYVHVSGVNKYDVKMLDEATSYKVEGFYFSTAFKSKVWDGRVHLFRFNRKTGYRSPVGMLDDIVEALREDEAEFKIVDERVEPEHVRIGWSEAKTPRDYQGTAVEKLESAGGSGIIQMPIRSGKTTTAAWYIHRRGVRTVFIVPSKQLLYQTRDDLEKCLGEKVGIIGDGKWEPRNVTVASIQTLVARRKTGTAEYKALLAACGLVVFDECHHLTSDEWRKAMMDFPSRYRVGLSATALIDRESEMGKGVIWLKASCGPIRHEVETSALIEDGHLVRPTFHLYRIREPDLRNQGWSQRLRMDAIIANPHRNGIIARLADEFARDGYRILIQSNRLDQVSELMEMFRETAVYVVGKMSKDERDEKLELFREGTAPILIGTVFGEGVDLPEIGVVINAEGGADPKGTIQRLRNLTPAPGKTEAIVIDFMDLTNGYFAAHSRDRLAEYRRESAFRFIIKELR